MDLDKKDYFQERLLLWHRGIERDLPWKASKDPYKIWLSEVILQQTRVEQGRAYYLRFVEAFPKIEDLAAASEDEVFKLWEGLGYYSRARNLMAAARRIVEEFEGVFPSTYKDILSLKGVGEYTAAAISSFAYDLPHAVLDGNVYRVLARYYGIDTPIDSTVGKKEFKALASKLLVEEQAAEYNQAIMDFGAVQCKPKKVSCLFCPLREECSAYAQGKVNQLPVKAKKIKKKNRYFYYLLIKHPTKAAYLVEKREGKDIWQNLYQFPMLELGEKTTLEDLVLTEEWQQLFKDASFEIQGGYSKEYKQTLSHQHIYARFIQVNTNLNTKALWAEEQQLNEMAFPKLINSFLELQNIFK